MAIKKKQSTNKPTKQAPSVRNKQARSFRTILTTYQSQWLEAEAERLNISISEAIRRCIFWTQSQSMKANTIRGLKDVARLAGIDLVKLRYKKAPTKRDGSRIIDRVQILLKED